MISLKNRLDAYEQLLHLHQPAGIFLMLWPILSALWLATGGWPPLSLVIIFVMGTLLMRSAGCAFNGRVNRNSGDNHHDAADSRAGSLTQGAIAPWEALAVAVVLTLIAFCFVWFTTRLAIGIFAVALVLAVALALLYPFYKRFFSLPQAAFGIVFLFGVPVAFAAANHAVPWYAWGLMGVNVFWVVACGIEYAIANREEDLARGRRSLALILGRYDVLATAICYGLFLAGMAGVGRWWRLGIVYWIALVLAAAGMACLLWLIRNREASRCSFAFRQNHWIVMVIFIGIAVDYALRMHAWPILGR